MFQAAACLGYAKKYGTQWGCPTDTREVPHFRKMFPSVPVIDGQFKRYNITDPSQFNYWPIPNFGKPTTLVGFCQSEKYFEGAHDEVKRLFKLDIKPVDAVSIHVRRGDYVQHANSFPPVTEEYLEKAVELFIDKYRQDFEIIVFSDDITWCKTIFRDDTRAIQFSEGKTEFEDLSLMASCSHHIIANSTFSWWGAWLGHNPDKIVVSPHHENWFGPGFNGPAPKDIIPFNWHQIKFR
jgi:hypothetical protein